MVALAPSPNPAGTPSIVNTVQQTSAARDQLLVLDSMVHYRILNLGSPNAPALHLSIGLNGQGQGFGGASLSFNRALYITGGWARQDVSSLTNGFYVGQAVSSGTQLTTTSTPQTKFAYGLNMVAAGRGRQRKKGNAGQELRSAAKEFADTAKSKRKIRSASIYRHIASRLAAVSRFFRRFKPK